VRREELGELVVFMAVAEERSFTRAAARLGTSQSSLSQTVRRLETRLGFRLLSRNTRRVVATEAGEQLLATLRPAIDDIDAKLTELRDLRQNPSGNVRITASQHAAETVLWPALERVLTDYPEVKLELSIDNALTDIVSQRFDAGVRMGEQVAEGMVAVRIGPDLRMAVVAAPSYFAHRSKPETPRDLPQHSCINIRLPTLGGLYVWEFAKDGHEINVRVDGQLVFNDMRMVLNAAMSGLGLAFVLEDLVEDRLAEGTLVRVLKDWCPKFPGYHLYFPNRRPHSAAFSLIMNALRQRAS
jgi:DNA-binding transcriptional LysR family regulator